MVWMKVPYTNFHNLNQDWIIRRMMEFEEYMKEIVSVSAIKYADPIQWRITGQYEANTVVIDAETGVAYISVQPVPAGVNITNTDYWTKVFDLTELLADYDERFDAIDNSITVINNTLDNVIDNQYWASVKEYGAVGDGITDDTAAIQACLDQTRTNYIQFPTGTYLVTAPVKITRSGMYVSGYGAKITKNDYTNNVIMMRIIPEHNTNITNITVEGLEFDGKKPQGAGTFDPAGSRAPAIDIVTDSTQTYNVTNVTLRDLYIHDNIGRGIGLDGGTTPYNPRVKNITVEGCYITNTRGAVVQSCVTSTVRNNTLEYSYLENITVDNGCVNCIIEGNRIGVHYGGGGNISMDEGRRVKIINNYIDNMQEATASQNNGITMNANTGTFTLVYISGNRIQGNRNNGIYARNNQFTPVNNLIITDNFFDGNMENEIKIEAITGTCKINTNVYVSGSTVTKINIPEEYYAFIKCCDAPLYYNVENLLNNGWTIQDANVTTIYKMGSCIYMILRLTAGSSGQFITMPSGSRALSPGHPIVFDVTTSAAKTGLISRTGTITVTASTAGNTYNIDCMYELA